MLRKVNNREGDLWDAKNQGVGRDKTKHSFGQRIGLLFVFCSSVFFTSKGLFTFHTILTPPTLSPAFASIWTTQALLPRFPLNWSVKHLLTRQSEGLPFVCDRHTTACVYACMSIIWRRTPLDFHQCGRRWSDKWIEYIFMIKVKLKGDNIKLGVRRLKCCWFNHYTMPLLLCQPLSAFATPLPPPSQADEISEQTHNAQ